MQVKSRKRSNGNRFWIARIKYFDGERVRTKLVNTGVRDDGSAHSKRAAEAIGREAELSHANRGSSAARSNRTLTQAVKELSNKQALAERSESSIEIITEKSENLFFHFGPDRPMYEIDDKAVFDYAVKARKERAATTVYRELLILRQAFQAIGMSEPKMPDLGEPPPARDRILEVDEQKKLIDALSEKRRTSVLAYLQLGLRKRELFLISEIDWKGAFARVLGSKTKRSVRWVPIGEELFVEISAAGDPWPGFPKWGNADRDLRAAAERAKIGPVSFNDLRRTYATMMARSGCPQLLLARYMGTSVRMLDEVYARLEHRGEHHHEAVRKGIPVLRRHRLAAAKARKERAAAGLPARAPAEVVPLKGRSKKKSDGV